MSRGLNAMKVLADLENEEARFSIDIQVLPEEGSFLRATRSNRAK